MWNKNRNRLVFDIFDQNRLAGSGEPSAPCGPDSPILIKYIKHSSVSIIFLYASVHHNNNNLAL